MVGLGNAGPMRFGVFEIGPDYGPQAIQPCQCYIPRFSLKAFLILEQMIFRCFLHWNAGAHAKSSENWSRDSEKMFKDYTVSYMYNVYSPRARG